VRSAYIGLGSNVGDRMANLTAALERLRSLPSLEIVRISSIYETDPVGEVPDQRDFYNAAIEARSEIDPHLLLDECKRIEVELGRRPGPRHGPRPIDIDLLMVGETTLADERLVLPHPELARRRFVLVPLLELDSELSLPDGTRLADALATLAPGQRVTRIGSLSSPR
jgi:2-amino-4-hydroxy-6-hydroxymethyldihydropteridine diphosphokinase